MDSRIRPLRPTELAMARELRWWVAAALLACGAVALAYLPPRGAGGKSRLRDEPFRQTPARQRAQALAAQWRAASLALRLPEYRKRLQPELLRRRERDEPGPALRSEEHTSELQSHHDLVCRLLLEKKKKKHITHRPSPTTERATTHETDSKPTSRHRH